MFYCPLILLLITANPKNEKGGEIEKDIFNEQSTTIRGIDMADRSRTKSGRYRKKRSDAGKKKPPKKKGFWDKFFE